MPAVVRAISYSNFCRYFNCPDYVSACQLVLVSLLCSRHLPHVAQLLMSFYCNLYHVKLAPCLIRTDSSVLSNDLSGEISLLNTFLPKRLIDGDGHTKSCRRRAKGSCVLNYVEHITGSSQNLHHATFPLSQKLTFFRWPHKARERGMRGLWLRPFRRRQSYLPFSVTSGSYLISIPFSTQTCDNHTITPQKIGIIIPFFVTLSVTPLYVVEQPRVTL